MTLNSSSNSTVPLPSLSFLQINSWAGAKHWKSKLRVKLTKNNEDEEKVEAETKVKETKEKKSRTSKKAIQFSFSDLSSDISEEIDTVWKPEGRRQDPRIFSNAMIEKMKSKSGELLLPEDKKIEMKDLCR